MQSSQWPVAMLLAVGAVVLTAASSSSIAQDGAVGQRVANLQEQLESGLKARRDMEFVFIARVVTRVHERHFSEGEVKSIFAWARRKNEKTPFPYFERAMRILAARKNVSL